MGLDRLFPLFEHRPAGYNAAHALRDPLLHQGRGTVEADEIEQTLSVNPTLQSIARVKKLRQPAPTQFRLRVGDFRVFYDVDEASKVVNVIQILSKADSFRYLEGSHED